MQRVGCVPRTTLRLAKTPSSCRTISTRPKAQARARAVVHPYAQRRQQHFIRSVATVAGLGVAATTWNWYTREVHAEAPVKEELEYEPTRRRGVSTEEEREFLSSQHVQVKKSLENPGVYAWGANAGKVVAPGSDEKYIKTPRRMRFFDGKLLKDIKLDRTFAAAIDEKGDLLQWGTAFSKNIKEPTYTLRGKNLVSLALSRDRVIALSDSGAVYSVPVSQKEQQTGPKHTEASSWLPWSSTTASISYRTHTPSSLGLGERVTDVKSGLEHGLLLTSRGRVFSFASGSEDFPSRGQLGIPGLTWQNRPAGPFDQAHEITSLRGTPISHIACGDWHSLASTASGQVYGFGDNTSGQLGFDYTPESSQITEPTLLPIQTPYSGTSQTPSVTNVFAGGNTSFFLVDATTPPRPGQQPTPRPSTLTRADTLACGFGLTGQLGTGKFTHAQSSITKLPSLSGLTEYSESSNTLTPIRLSYLSVGSSHTAAVLNNLSSTSTTPFSSTTTSTNFGKDILFWGNNEFYQIGTGKRNNVPSPTYLAPLDQDAELRREKAAGVLTGMGGMGADAQAMMHRFQITPREKMVVNGRTRSVEQKVECGNGVTAVYSAL